MAAVLVGGKVCTPEGILEPGVVLIEGENISAVAHERQLQPPPGVEIVDAAGSWVLPGFIDVHIHGLLGHDCMGLGLADVIRGLPAFGVTAFMATTVTRPAVEIDALIPQMAAVLADPPSGARCLGIHVEGPHLSPKRPGMANPEWFLPLSCAELDRFQELAAGSVSMLTFAPEEGAAMETMPYLVENDVVPVIGHSDADFELVERAVALGLSQATHTFNAMSPLHHRAPGVAGAVMALPQIVAQLIGDGHHVHAGAMKVLLNAKGVEGTCLISDAAPFAGLPAGEYRWGEYRVLVDGETSRLADGTLAGAHALLDSGFRNLINLIGLNPAEASQCASTVPAKSVGFGDRKGQLLPGYDADIAVLDADFWPQLTIVEGDVVWRAHA